MERIVIKKSPALIKSKDLKRHVIKRRHAHTVLIIESLAIHVQELKRGMIIAINAVMLYTRVSSGARQAESASH